MGALILVPVARLAADRGDLLSDAEALLIAVCYNPAAAVALGAGLLGERLTPAIGVSFVLILTGSVLATRAPAGLSLPAAPAPGPGRARPSDPARGT